MIENKKGQSGFGIVEVIVSLGLLATVLLATNLLSSLASRAWESSQNKTVAYGLIQQKFEDLRFKRDFNSYLGESFESGISNYDEVYALESTPAKKYRIKIDVYDEPVLISGRDYNNVNKKVRIKVSWSERAGERSVDAVTYLTDWRTRY